MTRIAYVIPANIVGASDQVIPPCMPMLGIAYLSAYLQKHAPGEFQEQDY